jgi:hypothetical protein
LKLLLPSQPINPTGYEGQEFPGVKEHEKLLLAQDLQLSPTFVLPRNGTLCRTMNGWAVCWRVSRTSRTATF